MDIHNLNHIFNPQRIALIGVTPNPKSVGGKVLGNLVGGGFRGVVYPEDVISLDARVILDQDVIGKQVKPFSFSSKTLS